VGGRASGLAVGVCGAVGRRPGGKCVAGRSSGLLGRQPVPWLLACLLVVLARRLALSRRCCLV